MELVGQLRMEMAQREALCTYRERGDISMRMPLPVEAPVPVFAASIPCTVIDTGSDTDSASSIGSVEFECEALIRKDFILRTIQDGGSMHSNFRREVLEPQLDDPLARHAFGLVEQYGEMEAAVWMRRTMEERDGRRGAPMTD